MYEFTCQKCGQVFEELMSISELEAGKTNCPACASKSVKRSMSTFATNSSGISSGPVVPGGCGGGGGFT